MIRHVGTSIKVPTSPGVFAHRRGILRHILRNVAWLRQIARRGSPVNGTPAKYGRDVGRQVDLDDLVDATEIARRLGVKRPQVVHDWRRRHNDFPEPIAHLGNGHVWLWPEIESWAVATGRL
jgi:hypothetical protein